jgi:acetyl-CoA synthetase
MNADPEKFMAARDVLLKARSYHEAKSRFQWPDLIHFNWALDYFDLMAKNNQAAALIRVDETGHEVRLTFDELSRRSSRMANFFKDMGFAKSDTVLLLLSNRVELYEVLLAALKTSVVVTPASPLLTAADLDDRIRRGHVKHIIAEESFIDRVASSRRPTGYERHGAALSNEGRRRQSDGPFRRV